MFPAKIFYNLFPRVVVGSHCSINRLAYAAVQRLAPELRLPKLYLINQFEGLNGVDGLWLHNRVLPSRSTYNPMTEQGNGLKELRYQFDALRQAASIGRKVRLAQRLAYVSHIVTDVCTPPHQHGKMVDLRRKRWYLFWLVNDDWYERSMERYWVDKHTLFEFRALLAVWRQRLPTIRIVPEWQGMPLTEATAHVVTFVRETVCLIRSYDLYQQYVDHGWTERIQQQFVDDVFPRIATTVATIWYLALANSAVTAHHPLVRREFA